MNNKGHAHILYTHCCIDYNVIMFAVILLSKANIPPFSLCTAK